MKRLVFVGNCQLGALMRLYREYASKALAEELFSIDAFAPLSERDLQAIKSADVIVDQLFETKPPYDIMAIATTRTRISVPLVTGGFLWPFGGQAHPKNEPTFGDNGPFPAELGDVYLNRLINQGVHPDEAAVRYADVDVHRLVNLDRLLEVYLERQRVRDDETGFQVASLIAQHFRSEQLFLTPYHPGLRITLAVAAQLFRRLGVDDEEIQIMTRHLPRTPFPLDELPIHPRVREHHCLEYAAPDYRYRQFPEGWFTFHDYVRRYVSFDVNQLLREGMWRASCGEDLHATSLLREGLKQNPRASGAWQALGSALDRLGSTSEALSALSEAIAIAPACAEHWIVRAKLFSRMALWKDAVHSARTAVNLEPRDQGFRMVLADLLREQGDVAGATEALRCVIGNSPKSYPLQLRLTELLAQQNLDGEAIAAAERAIELQPMDNAQAYNHLSHALECVGRLQEAIQAGLRAIEVGPPLPVYHFHLAQLLASIGEDDRAAVQRRLAGDLQGLLDSQP